MRACSAWGCGQLRSAGMEDALHDLCQPLTAMQCRLFLATLVKGDERQEEMEKAVADGLRLCERAIGLVRGMQQRMED